MLRISKQDRIAQEKAFIEFVKDISKYNIIDEPLIYILISKHTRNKINFAKALNQKALYSYFRHWILRLIKTKCVAKKGQMYVVDKQRISEYLAHLTKNQTLV